MHMAHAQFLHAHRRRRFLDVDEEKHRPVQTITGYNHLPLVTLEAAIEPIVRFCPDIREQVHIAKSNVPYPKDGLTKDESAAIYLYTREWHPREQSLYVRLNWALRSHDHQRFLVPWVLYIKLLFTAVSKLHPCSTVVWRGVPLDLRKDYDLGKTVTWYGFSSCTRTMSVLESSLFLGQEGKRTIFSIECLNGRKIREHSSLPSEDEILLLPGSQFMVKDHYKPSAKDPDLLIIQLQQIEGHSSLFEFKYPTTTTADVPINKIDQSIIPKSRQMIHISSNARWFQTSVIIAGGRGKGDALNQLYTPWGLSLDDRDGTLFIADCFNHRIVAWKQFSNTHMGRLIAGGGTEGHRLDQLKWPTDVLLDKENESLIICDHGNRRVMQWSLRNGTTHGHIIIDNIDCWGLAMDKEGYLYVTDKDKHEVRRCRRGDHRSTVVAGGHGKGDRLNQLNEPAYLFVDDEGSIYVSDKENDRVMKWMKGAREGIIVAGGRGKGSCLSQLWYPRGIFVDDTGSVYVAEWGNARVTRWRRGMNQGEIVVGGKGKGEGTNQFNGAEGLSFDGDGNLYIADWGNHRVQRFDIIKSS